MITKEYAEGLSEVLLILDNTETEYVNKIPEKVRNFFKENAAKDYTPRFNPNQEIKDMELKDETKHILSVIYMNYWVTSKEEKQEFNKLLTENQTKFDEEIREKYNPDKIFENQTEEPTKAVVEEDASSEPVRQEEALTVYKENFFTKLVSKIKTWIQKIINK